MANVTYSSRAKGQLDRALRIEEFQGVDESRGVFNRNYATSPSATNFIARDGELRTAGGVTQLGQAIPHTVEAYTPDSKPRLHQAHFRDESGAPTTKLLASFNRKIYALDQATGVWSAVGTIEADGCDMVNYRHEDDEWAILTDGAGEMYQWDGGAGGFADLDVTQGGTEIKFQQIALLYERLFGGVFADSPDRIYWSDSFSPDDWDFNVSLPDEGGGFADVATFDGSRIRAIVPALDDVLIFKDHSVHRLSGTYPGEFSISQIFGTSGTLSPRTIVNTGSKVYFLSNEGLCMYDGMSVVSLKSTGDRRLVDTWAKMNHNAFDIACAALYNNVMYIAVRLDNSVSYNTHVIEFDTVTGQYSIVGLSKVDDFLVYREGQKETLLAISWDKVYKYDTGATFYGQAINAKWTSPELSFGSMASKKATGYIYMTVTAAVLDAFDTPKLKLSMLSGKRTSVKIVPLKVGKNEIRKRLKVRGRSFQFQVENMNGDPLTINRGIEIMVEEDPD